MSQKCWGVAGKVKRKSFSNLGTLYSLVCAVWANSSPSPRYGHFCHFWPFLAQNGSKNQYFQNISKMVGDQRRHISGKNEALKTLYATKKRSGYNSPRSLRYGHFRDFRGGGLKKGDAYPISPPFLRPPPRGVRGSKKIKK